VVDVEMTLAQRALFPTTLALLAIGGVSEIFSPEQVHGPVVRAVGVLLLLASFLWLRALRRHRETERELARSEERLTTAQEVAGIGTWDIEETTGAAVWSDNLRRLMGVTADAPAGYEEFLDLVHPDDRESVQAEVDEAYRQGGDFAVSYRLRRSGGRPVWLESRGRVTLDEVGSPLRALGITVDITAHKEAAEEQEKLERQLRQAQKMESVGRLAGGVAHDFNNLLLAIRGYAEVGATKANAHENPHEELEEIIAAADRASGLTRQLLAFSRKQVLNPEVLDLNDTVRAMERLLGRLLGEDLELAARTADEPVWVNADRGQLEQVIANLAVNARDAMRDGGRLSLEVSTVEAGSDHGAALTPGRYALLAVRDTGIGMDPETTAQIFEPFFTTKREGTGLGLATVHGIVKQSGGSIWVYSEVGVGTTFKIYLPLTEDAVPVRPAEPPISTRGSNQAILLVEDDPQVCRIVARTLSARNYRVLAASNDEDALRLAHPANGRIDLLLSDVVMPGLGGRELAARIRLLQPDIRVLYMSGYTDDAVIRRGGLSRTAAFIEKPFSSEELASKVRELLVAA
jgi:two-component system, cell cycle sensor histidine kinase and response regulator CckA